MDDHRVLAGRVEGTDLQRFSVGRRSDCIVRSSSISTQRMALRTACAMSASLTPRFRAGPPIRT